MITSYGEEMLTLLGKLKAFVILWGWGLFFLSGDVGRVPCFGSLLFLKFALYVDVPKGSFDGYSYGRGLKEIHSEK